MHVLLCDTGPLVALSSLGLLDERKARKLARRVFGLETIGTAGILVQARRRGLAPELGPLFAQLRQQNYWIDDTIVSWALQEAP